MEPLLWSEGFEFGCFCGIPQVEFSTRLVNNITLRLSRRRK